MAESCRYCYEDFKQLDPKSVKKHLRPVILEPLESVSKKFNQLSEWSSENIESCIKDTVASYDITMGKLGQPLRVAVTGGSVSPPIDKTIWLIGKDRILRRLEQAIKIIEKKVEN
jgi:glutamyl-tRNA synthetase